MTNDEFRAIALNLGGVTESSHMKHPDFRAHGKIFAQAMSWKVDQRISCLGRRVGRRGRYLFTVRGDT